MHLLSKLSDLTEVSITPKPIKILVSICLQVFRKKLTLLYWLIYHSILKRSRTSAIYKALQWWNIVNVKTCGADSRSKDQYCVPIDDPEDQRLLILLEFGDMAMKMVGKQGSRVKKGFKRYRFCSSLNLLWLGRLMQSFSCFLT